MKILITGATGFLGKIMVEHLAKIYDVATLGRYDAQYISDLSINIPQFSKSFDRVIHAAGLAHVFGSASKNHELFNKVNVQGTVNLFKGLQKLEMLPKEFVFISSVAVYGKKQGVLLSEDNELKATDPYGYSKIQAETVVQDWCEKHQVKCIILRLPLIVGDNAPGNLGKMVEAIKKNRYFTIGDGHAAKSMVLGSDVAKLMAQKELSQGIYNLTDGTNPTFAQLENVLVNKFKSRGPIRLPYFIARALGYFGDIIVKFLNPNFPFSSDVFKKITSDLTFDDSHAKNKLNWSPSKVLEFYVNN